MMFPFGSLHEEDKVVLEGVKIYFPEGEIGEDKIWK